MTLSNELQNCRVWIAGAARSGLGAAQILKNGGAHVFVSDQASIPEDSKQLLRSLDIGFEEGGHSFDRFGQEAELLVVSPAILLDRGLALHARRHNIPIVSEIEVASWVAPHNKICGITGTNGKSTTTNYLAQLLARDGQSGVACGNIGKAFSHACLENKDAVFAVELSSYQLESTYSLRPQVTVLLNLQLDHQARYENLDDYLKAKWRLLLLTADNGVACVDTHCFERAMRLGLSLPRCQVVLLGKSEQIAPSGSQSVLKKIEFGKTLPVSLYHDLRKVDAHSLFSYAQLGHAFVKVLSDRSLAITVESATINANFHVRFPCLPGEHNAQNLLAASVAALAMGVSTETVRAQWEQESTHYAHLPHRLERVGGFHTKFRDERGENKKIAIINDSKATNVESVLVALKSFDKPLRVLLGGDPKGESYAPLASFCAKPVVKFYPFGRAGSQVFNELHAISPKHVAPAAASLFDAAACALNDSADGDIVMLSPACASFDEFKNFEHRGDKFREWALARVSSEEKQS
jgi:UDP-N-acetylmuramoylalanine--D-glutamate ligase